ncbi:MAG: ABC transporter permease [Chloroflexi bacterium]|nr:ABC transporter permease [Chloroflexota bacterium]
MSNVALKNSPNDARSAFAKTLDALSNPLLAILLAFVLGAVIIAITSGNISTVPVAYIGLIEGAFFKTRGLSESLVATIPYVLASLAVALGFKAGLFNIGVEGQFYIGSLTAAAVGAAFHDLPALIHLPLVLIAAALGGAVWGAIPGILKAKTGAHEVINTIMMNYIAYRLTEFLVSNVLRDKASSAVQTIRISPNAELWNMATVPARLTDPLNAIFIALLLAITTFFFARWLVLRTRVAARFQTAAQKRAFTTALTFMVALAAFFFLPLLTQTVWPWTDPYDRLHIGLFLAPAAAVSVAWLLNKTTIGFELRTVGANPSAAQYAGINIGKNIVLAMALSGALAGLAGAIEVLGVSICRCLPLFFSAGYGFDSIAIALLARADAIGILPSSFLFGALRNGADLMELRSGVSKHVISLIQALVLLFVAAPAIVRYLTRQKTKADAVADVPLTRGWGR